MKRLDVSAHMASVICGVSKKTIFNWEKGKSTPDKYPGRYYAVALVIWSRAYYLMKKRKETKIRESDLDCGCNYFIKLYAGFKYMDI